MIEKLKITASFEKFDEDGENFKKDKEINSYYISYPEFIEYFKNRSKIEKHDLIIGINFVYGWMPRTLKFHSDNFDDVLTILNKAKSGQQPLSKEDLDKLKDTLDHSLIGASKLLHFINPEAFAIWDSKVYKYITGEETAYHHKTEKSESYLAYLKFCDELTEREEYEGIHSKICEAVGYKMTKFRTAELIMFSSKDNEKQN